MDNRNLRDGRDRNRVSGSEEYELKYMAEKMGCSIDEVRNAIKAVGNDRQKVEQYLNGRNKR